MKRHSFLFFLLPLLGLFSAAPAALRAQTGGVESAVKAWFRSYAVEGYRPHDAMRADSVVVNDSLRTVCVYANEPFCSQPLSPQVVKRVYTGLQRSLPAPRNAYRLSVMAKGGRLIEDLVPNILREGGVDASRLWGGTDYNGQPWVRNASLPYRVTAGLEGRHLFIWPSHGRYYKNGAWRWQRPLLYCTAEDLLTQSFVYPFLFPMLERAGAVVDCPRERDCQRAEAVVDNDHPARQGSYAESGQDDAAWTSGPAGGGFAAPDGLLNDSVFPFASGTWRSVPAVQRKTRLATAEWMPRLPRTGRYAVYVSYASRPNSVPDARYTVYHRGGRTTFHVNQQMGGGTWVYLGTFDFDAGQDARNRVVLSNQSNHRGVVTADGVRFGGGVGQTERGECGTSGLPRFLESARYYAQWAGVPDTLFNTERGMNDYSDDLRTRGNMLNWLAGGSPFLPGKAGGRVPFELSLALHSDAGVRTDGGIYGSLAISTTPDGRGGTNFSSGLSRGASADLADLLLGGVQADLSAALGTAWPRRERWDRNYAETRMPDVPAAILEMFSHQNYRDMCYAHDPLFKFFLARSVYKSLLRYVRHEHGLPAPVVQPLPPVRFAAALSADGASATLSWQAQDDPQEATAKPDGYILYISVDGEAFDNGQSVGAATAVSVPLSPGRRYAFRVSAVNAGGESFPSETLAACNAGTGSRRALIVNGFDRLSGPARVERGDSLGFDLDADFGVPYIYTTAYAGRQTNFTTRPPEQNCGHELAGKQFAGNTFDYPVCHGEAIAAAGGWSYASASRDAFAQPGFSLQGYDVVDYIGGLQADLPQNLRSYKLFPAAVRRRMEAYVKGGGSLLVSGSYVGSDNRASEEEKFFLSDILKCRYDGSARTDSTDYVRGLNLTLPLWREPSEEHYAAQALDALWPAGGGAFTAFAYGGGQSAGVAYKGDTYRAVTMGFPFECIRDAALRARSMQALLRFLAE